MSQSSTRPSSARSTAPMDTAHTAWDASSSMKFLRHKPQRSYLNSQLMWSLPQSQSQRWMSIQLPLLKRRLLEALETSKLPLPSPRLRSFIEISLLTASMWVSKSTKRRWKCSKRRWPRRSNSRVSNSQRSTTWTSTLRSSRDLAASKESLPSPMRTTLKMRHTKRVAISMEMPLPTSINLTKSWSNSPPVLFRKTVESSSSNPRLTREATKPLSTWTAVPSFQTAWTWRHPLSSQKCLRICPSSLLTLQVLCLLVSRPYQNADRIFKYNIKSSVRT